MHLLSQPAPKIFALPSELIEEALVIAAARGFPSAIAAFGSSCRHFHHLVYHSVDHHLWREIFLTTFDDPRSVLRLLRNTTTTGPGGGDKDIVFDWAGEFQRRMNAARLFRKLYKTTPTLLDLFSHSNEESSIGVSLTLMTALETVISVLETSVPFPSHENEVISPASTLPRVVMLHVYSTYPPEFISRNSRWVDEIVRYGYPPSLVKNYLLAGHHPLKPPKVTEDNCSTYTEEGQLFNKLVFRKGFIPVPTGRKSEVPWKTLQTIEDQSAAARKVARSKVYNLRYLRPERSWGPFLPANGSLGDADAQPKSNPTFPDFEQELSRYMLSNVGEGLNDSEDGDFVPAEDDQDEDDDNDEGILGFPFARRRFDPKFVMPRPHEAKPDYTYLAAARLLVEMNLREVLIMDEAVHETTEGSGPEHAITDALASLDFGRMGGAPGFWDKTWVEPESTEELDSPSIKQTPLKSNRKGKGKATEVEWIQGWDWAGVAGRWVRVVCWLDYRDLLREYITPSFVSCLYGISDLENILSAQREHLYLLSPGMCSMINFQLRGHNGDDMSETIRFFPTDLRIVGYSRPPEPDFSQLELRDLDAPVWKLPIIHIEGISHGPHDDPGTHNTRIVKGTVRMVKDGAIRWSLTSFNEDAPEWSTEGIQIGCIGSAVGMLGMWTGADHASTDPLGPIWTWKVA
ncbi:hypothetical protein C0995_015246 [Termitomyces sp. Mi166|nr:hypothetical protein C0995_015246 [Termitomyces sp. Mi166\